MSQYQVDTAPMLAGTQANWLLLGTLAIQVYKFYVCFPKERWWIKALVYTLFTLEVLQTAVTSHFVYTLLVVGWGDPEVLVKLPWSSLAVPIFTGITSASVQIFFAWRIWALKYEHIWARMVAILIVMLALMQGLAAFITDARFAVTTQVAVLTKLKIGVKVWLIGSAVCDVVITLSMVVIFTEYRKRVPWTRTDTLLTKLIYNTVETGGITTFVAVVDVTLFLVYPDTNLHQTPAFMLGKLYANVLLATLNTRVVMGTPSMLADQHSANWVGNQNNTELQWRRYGPPSHGPSLGGDMIEGDIEAYTGSKGQLHIHTHTVTHVIADDIKIREDKVYDGSNL